MGISTTHIQKDRTLRKALQEAEKMLPRQTMTGAQWMNLISGMLAHAKDAQQIAVSDASTMEQMQKALADIQHRMACISVAATRCIGDVIDILNREDA